MADQDPVNAVPLPGVGAAAAAPMPVDTRQTGSSSNYSSTQIKPSAQSAAALADIDAANKGAAEAGQALGDAKALQQTQIADQAGVTADRLGSAVADAAAENQAYLDRIHAAQAVQAEDAQALKDYKFHDYFHDADGERKVGKTILTGLGSLFGGLGGTEAAKAVANQLHDQIGQDFDLQRQQYSKLMDQRKMAGEDTNALYQEWERKNAASLYKEGLAREAAAARAIEVATRSGIPLSIAENNLFVKKQQAEAAAKKLESTVRYDRSITSGSTKETRNVDVTGKPGAGGQITDKERAADDAQEKLINDAATMNSRPYNDKEKDAIRRTLAEEPSIWDRATGLFHGELPDYFANLNESERDHVNAALRVIPTYATQQFGPRGASNKAALSTMAMDLLPTEGMDEGAMTRRQNVLINALKSQAETTPRPAYWRQIADQRMARPTAPAGEAGSPVTSTAAAVAPTQQQVATGKAIGFKAD